MHIYIVIRYKASRYFVMDASVTERVMRVKMAAMIENEIKPADYVALAEFRYLLRCFLEFSETEAKRVGLAPQQHQAILAIKGFGATEPVSIGTLAERLRIRHHTAVELVNRLVDGGLVQRSQDPNDHRRARLTLTSSAEERLAKLSAVHLDELSRIEPMLNSLLPLHRALSRQSACSNGG